MSCSCWNAVLHVSRVNLINMLWGPQDLEHAEVSSELGEKQSWPFAGSNILAANMPKIMIYSPDSICVNEGKVISPLSCAAAPTSWQTESGDCRNEVLAVSQSRCVTCFHFSDMLVMSSSAPASPLIKVKLGPCSFLAAGINKCKQKEHGVCSQIIISKQIGAKHFQLFSPDL